MEVLLHLVIKGDLELVPHKQQLNYGCCCSYKNFIAIINIIIIKWCLKKF